jgi:hypothetical protein
MNVKSLALLALTFLGCSDTVTSGRTADADSGLDLRVLSDAQPSLDFGLDAEPLLHALLVDDTLYQAVPYGERPESLIRDDTTRMIAAFALQGCGGLYVPKYRGTGDYVAVSERLEPRPEQPDLGTEDMGPGVECGRVQEFEACGDASVGVHVCVQHTQTYIKPVLIEAVWIVR